jgi:hypothetical protein
MKQSLLDYYRRWIHQYSRHTNPCATAAPGHLTLISEDYLIINAYQNIVVKDTGEGIIMSSQLQQS